MQALTAQTASFDIFCRHSDTIPFGSAPVLRHPSRLWCSSPSSYGRTGVAADRRSRTITSTPPTSKLSGIGGRRPITT